MPAGARRRLAAAVLALAFLAGCRVDLAVGVRAEADGSGRVEATVLLDPEATARVPDLAAVLRTDDLARAGWRVEGPTRREDGGTQVRARKAFRSPEGAARALRELTGPQGPFRDLRLSQRRSLLRTRTGFSGLVDLSSGLDGFSDETLRQRLGGLPLGVDRATLERQVGKPLAEAFRVRVTARLPGDVDANGTIRAGEAEWTPALGQRLPLEASAEGWNVARLVLAGVAVTAALALLVVLVRRLVSWIVTPSL